MILREPFRPSLPASAGSKNSFGSSRGPGPELRMPVMDFDESRTPSGRSSRTVRPHDAGVRRRTKAAMASPTRRRAARRTYSDNSAYDDEPAGPDNRTVREHIADTLPAALYGALVWTLSVLGLALRYARKPLAFLLAVYLSLGSLIIAQNLLTKSLSASLSPLCRIPFAQSLLHLPFCPDYAFSMPWSGSNGSASVEFDDLMGVQGKFEQVLEKSADGVSLPFEMKKSESSIRDLRSLVRNSDIQAKDELVLEFDGYIDTARTTASDLQRFNTHVGSAVDAVISINRWTSRYLDSLAPPEQSSNTKSTSAIGGFTNWLFYPFTPATQSFDEKVLLDKYIEHTALVSDRIDTLILEAQAVLRLLTKAEDHLSLIYDITSRTSATVSSRREEVLWNIWTLVGANHARLSNLSTQLSLLRQVDRQRTSAVAQVSALILELETIQAGLGDLRDRVAEPQLLKGSSGPGGAIPLSVHIDTIDRGVERLEDARSRIRAAENDRVREALTKSGLREDDRLLESR